MPTIQNGRLNLISRGPAQDDTYNFTEDQLLSLSLFDAQSGILSLNVMANDSGGNAKTLYSVDDGVNYLGDLLNADTLVGGMSVWEAIGGGDKIRIDSGKVDIDISPSLMALTGSSDVNSLGVDDRIIDTFVYTVRQGNVLSMAQVTLVISGNNDAPVAVADVASVKEDTNTSARPNPVIGNVLVNDVDPDVHDNHGISAVNGVAANVGAALAGRYGTLTLTADGTYSYRLDNSSIAVQALAEGQSLSESFTYTNSDDHGESSAATLTIAIEGANDAPSVSGAVTGVATEDGASSTLNALANATDVDDGTSLLVLNVPANLPDGVTYNAAAHSFTLDSSNAAYQHLAAGQTATVTASYGVSDGTVTTPASVSWTVTGVNDAPVVTGAATGAATEDGASSTLNALANATDAEGDLLSVVDVPNALPPGVTFNTPHLLGIGDYAGITIPAHTTDGATHADFDGVWSVTAPPFPININSGIGYLINPSNPTDAFSLHDHQYIAPNVPDPSAAVVTFQFTSPTIVNGLDVVEHGNGVTKLHGYIGNSLDSLTDIGAVFGSLGDLTGAGQISEGAHNLFDFDNSIAGTFFQVVIDKTSLPDGYALYRMFPQGIIAGSSFTLDPSDSAYQHLAAGQTTTVTVSYGVSDGAATTAASASWTVTGANDAPVVTGAVAGTATEDGPVSTVDALGTASDVDDGTTLSVVNVPANLPAGVSYDAATHSFTLDASDAAYQHLAAGQTTTVTVSYDVSDGTATMPASVSWTVTGANDAPVVTRAVTGAATEDGASSTLDALANATDVDDGTSLAVVNVPASLPAGVRYNAAAHGFTLDPSDTAYQHLAAGQTATVTASYGVSDGTATTPASVSWTVTGANDAPMVTGAVTGAATEDGASSTLNALANATDAEGDLLSVVEVPNALPPGVTFNTHLLGIGDYAAIAIPAHTTDGATHADFDGVWSVTAPPFPININSGIGYLINPSNPTDAFSLHDHQYIAPNVPDPSVAVVTFQFTSPTIVNGMDVVEHGNGVTKLHGYIGNSLDSLTDIGAVFGSLGDLTGAGQISEGAHNLFDFDNSIAGTFFQVVIDKTSLPDGYALYRMFPQGIIAGSSFTLDPSDSAYQHLAAGQTTTVTVSYGVSDGAATTAASASWTVTGANDAPVVTGAVAGTATEDGPVSTVDALATTSDVDDGTNLSVINVPANLPAGVTYDAAAHSFALDPSASAYQYLAAGETISVAVNYVVSDGSATTPASVSWTLTGTNDVPVIGGTTTGGVTENTNLSAGNLAGYLTTGSTLTIADADHDQSTFIPQTGTAGSYGTFTLAADGTWSYRADDGQAAIQQLGALQSLTDSFTAVSSDGSASQQVTVTISGSRDIAFYNFDEGSGTIAHNQEGLNPHDGTVVNGATFVPGVTGSALSFNGVNQYVNVLDSSDWNFNSGDFSIQLYANFDSMPTGTVGGPTGGVLIGQDEGSGNTNKWFIEAYADSDPSITAEGKADLGLHVNIPSIGPQFFLKTPFVVNPGQWHLIQLDKSGSSYQFHIDEQAGQAETKTFTLPDINHSLTIGGAESLYFKGRIDDVSIAKHSLSLPAPIAAYGFDETSGSIAYDQQGNHNGTIVGATLVAGVTGDAVAFNGSTSSPNYVDIPDSADWTFGTSNFGIQFWANFDSVPGGGPGAPGDVLIGQDEGAGNTTKWLIEAYAGSDAQHANLGLHVNSPTLGPLFLAATPFVVNPGQWHFIQLSKNGTSYQFFVDGQPGPAATGTFAMPDVNHDLTIGASEGVYFNGKLDDLAIYRHALLMPAGVSGSEINLGLSEPDGHTGDVILKIAELPSDWTLNGAMHNSDGSWTVAHGKLASLSVTTPAAFAGAHAVAITETWTNADGTSSNIVVDDNIEAYSAGVPIFAWTGDDFLTGSAGRDVFVFAPLTGSDHIFGFDATNDRMVLSGRAGFSSFANVQNHLEDDSSGDAVLTLAEGQSITVDGVHAASLRAENFAFDHTPELNNDGIISINDGAILPLSGTINNTGTIALDGASHVTMLEVTEPGVTLEGHGHVLLSDSFENVVSGSSAIASLTNVDNVISGAGQIGTGQLTLINGGMIDASGSRALMIDTGPNTISNSGVLEAEGPGGMIVNSDVANSGLLWANGGNLTLKGEVTGSGSALISGTAALEFGAASSMDTTFDVGSIGRLQLAHAAAFGGTVAGFGQSDQIRFGDVAFGTDTLVAFTANADGTGGRLVVTDGNQTASVAMLGHYAADNFQIGEDSGFVVLTGVNMTPDNMLG